MVLIQQIVNGVMLGASYSLIAIGYTLVFGVLHLVHLAHGEVFMIGAFIGLQVVLLTGGGVTAALSGAAGSAGAVCCGSALGCGGLGGCRGGVGLSRCAKADPGPQGSFPRADDLYHRRRRR